MPKNGYTDEELEDLTPEERQALDEIDAELSAADDDDGADAAAAANEDDAEADKSEKTDDADSDADADAENGTDDQDSDDEAAKEKADDGQAEPADAAAAEKDEASAEDKPDQKGPKSTFVAPADLNEKLEAVQAKLDDLAAQFDEGDITAAEYRAEQRKLSNEERDINSLLIRAEVSKDIQMSSWNDTCSDFIASHPEYKAGSPLHSALDAEVRRLQTESGNNFDPSHLENAHRNIRAAFGLDAQPGSKDADPAGKDKDTAAAKDKQDGKTGLGDIPPNLAGVPASDINDESGGGKFAFLDKLADGDDVEAYEAALDKLSETERAAYMQS